MRSFALRPMHFDRGRPRCQPGWVCCDAANGFSRHCFGRVATIQMIGRGILCHRGFSVTGAVDSENDHGLMGFDQEVDERHRREGVNGSKPARSHRESTNGFTILTRRPERGWWRCYGLNPLVDTSPVDDDGIAVSGGGYDGNSIVVEPGVGGGVTSSSIAVSGGGLFTLT